VKRTGRLPRHTRMAAKNAKRGGRRFPKRRDPAYCAWIRTLPCCVPAMTPEEAMARCRRESRPAKWLGCWPQSRVGIQVLADLGLTMPISECAHVKAKGAGGDDVGNTVPMCMRHHRQQHAIGIKTFQATYGVDLAASASDIATRYPAARVWADHRDGERA
jgi:hypothetical protein